MFDPVPDLNLEATVEIGDVAIDKIKARAGESSSFVSKNKRLFIHKTKNEERKLSLRFFISRVYFLSYKEVNYLFRCLDTISDVSITKKNNVIVAPYMVLLTLSSKGYKFTDSMIELFFPELYNEHSKKFRFNSQICIIQEKLGYSTCCYHSYDFELYYSTIALAIRNNLDKDIFNTREESEFVSSLSEITYRFYLINLKFNYIQWSSSTGSVINQMVNVVLLAIFDFLEKCTKENKFFTCTLAIETKVPVSLLIDRISLIKKIILDLKCTNSFKVSKRDKREIYKYFIVN
ncbi:intermediate transcription factor VITF-3 [Tanapox virus]|uniref:Intermediate transcription factor 3 small subunit n=2 Tax=Tanapox virus TaxID=99000 RepID=A7XCM8_9POXV|nr:99R protein [Yaba-like disease virus]ABQ43574.1 intermediate transcription factor VITF-3 [Tanapox virus]ABQ43729.1 intermediate transcription factor VITF-3 [Tanapox virus]CAC21337.1 99R protein [Yaba-like disease virus]